MAVERIRLTVTAAPPFDSEARPSAFLVLVLGATSVAGAICSVVIFLGAPLTGPRLFEGAVWASAVYFCVPAIAWMLWRPGSAQYVPGQVSYEQQPGSLTIRTPRAAKVMILIYMSLGCVALGTCSVIALCWTISSGDQLTLVRWVLMPVACVLLPAGIGMMIWAIRFGCTRLGVTLTPTHVSAQAEGSRLVEVDWEAITSVSVALTEPTKYAPATSRLSITLADGEFSASWVALASDPHSVRQVVEFFRQHPEHRHTIADASAAMRLVQRELAAGWVA